MTYLRILWVIATAAALLTGAGQARCEEVAQYDLIFVVYAGTQNLRPSSKIGIEPLLLTDTNRLVFVADLCTYLVAKDKLDLTNPEIKERYELHVEQIKTFGPQLIRYCHNKPVTFDLKQLEVRNNMGASISIRAAKFIPWNTKREKLVSPPPPLPPIAGARIDRVHEVSVIPRRKGWAAKQHEYLIAADGRLLQKILPQSKHDPAALDRLAEGLEQSVQKEKGRLGTWCLRVSCDASDAVVSPHVTDSRVVIHELLIGDIDGDGVLDLAIRAWAEVTPKEVEQKEGWLALGVAFGNGAMWIKTQAMEGSLDAIDDPPTYYPTHSLAPQAVLRLGGCTYLLTSTGRDPSYESFSDSADLISIPKTTAACPNRQAVKHYPNRAWSEPEVSCTACEAETFSPLNRKV